MITTDLIYNISVWLLPVLIAITFHEAAHGYVARFLGDDTASRLGRVSLNPVRHIDPFGTIILPALLLLARSPFLFGYAPSQSRLISGHFILPVLAWCLLQQRDQ
jgi:Zn-dependent protease